MRRSCSSGRAQAEPTVTLAAVLAIVFGLTAYALVLADSVPNGDRDLAGPTLERVEDHLTTGGIAEPSRVERAPTAGPSGRSVNVTLTSDDHRWTAGPEPPRTADTDSTSVGVRLRPGTVRSATLQVGVWP
ncbi:DUF7285 family protein [Halorarum halobium]|uniref:DUF7285 family protein n=1 Tax=Halorarum halobium TaxID=3075121 RepID=UPI0028A9EEA9|nr:hypothetical protein [Halobaculum sp. XH14]